MSVPQPPQPPQPPRIPPVQPPRMPRPPGAPPGAGKLGGLFKRRGKEEAFIEDDSPEDSQAPAADGSAAAGAQATAEVAPEPAPAPYETWAWPSIEPKQEKRKVPVAAIVIVLLLVLGGAGFGVYKLVHKDKKSSTPAAKAAAPAAKKPKPKPAAAPSKAKAEKAFAGDIEAILAQSVAQRGKLVQVLAATENGCSIPIAKAKQQVDAVAAGRQSLLAKAKGLSAPTAQATKVKGLLTKALAASLAANRHYAAWVGGLAGASPCPGSTSGNADFAAAGTASVQASSAKQAFTKAFNPLARRVGQKTWSPDAI